MNVTEIFLQALAHHKKGDLREAESLYRAILADHPLHPDANHNLGAIARQVGKLDASLPYFQRAIEANPVQGLFWSSYVSALIDLGQSAQAMQVVQNARQGGMSGRLLDELQSILGLTLRMDAEQPLRPALAQLLEYQKKVFSMRNSACLEYPAHIHLETFAKCNASCSFCPYPDLERQGERMSDELLEKIIADLKDIPSTHQFQLSPFKVNEPFLDSRLFELIENLNRQLPNAGITLTSNASPITEKKLERLAGFSTIGYLWISFNDHRKTNYEATMKLSYDRTIARLDMIHAWKSSGRLKIRVVLSRVGDGSATDDEFLGWVKLKYPLFDASVFPRGGWIGQVDVQQSPPPDVGCSRWFDLSITATGVVAHCCMDGHAEYPIGDVRFQHVLEIYNSPEYRRLREATISRLQVDPCRGCSFL